MCALTQHRAESSVLYINNQLEAKWESAKRYIAKQHSTKFEPSTALAKASTCLYEFFVHESNGRGFYARFDVPRVEFLCNHEVILFLTISNFNVEGPKPPLSKDLDIVIPFLIKYDTAVYQDTANNARGTRANHAFEIHTLDISSALHLSIPFEKFILKYAYKDVVKTKLADYIKDQYLPTFKSAGHHILHALPDHDNLLETTAHIDYSFRTPLECRSYIDAVHGIHIDAINNYLSQLWTQYSKKIELSDDDSILRAQLETDWISGVNNVRFHLVLGQPHVDAFCTSEVVLNINVQAVEVLSSNISPPKPNWDLAFVVDVARIEVDGVTCLKLDLTKPRLRFRKDLSRNIAEGFHLHKELIKYIEKHYFEQVDQLSCRVIYNDRLPEPKVIPVPQPIGDVGYATLKDCPHHGCIAWNIWRRQLDADLCGFDTVTTISQGSINAHFAALYEPAWKEGVLLTEWAYKLDDEVFFQATFVWAPRIQLVCTEESSCKAILYLFVGEGHLHLVEPDRALGDDRFKPSSRRHPISGWRIALEVDLDIIETTTSSNEKLVVNFSKARVVPEHSYLPTALAWQDEAFTALTFYLANSYITELRDFQLLYSIPITNKVKHAFLKPQVLPFCYGAGVAYMHHDRQITVCDHSAIVLLGMFNGREPPQLIHDAKKDIPATTTYISRRLFLDSVLRSLEQVNEKTTVIANPNFALFDEGGSFLQLSVYSRGFKRKGLPFAWKQLASDDNCLQYEWTNRDEWRYEHVGDFVDSADSGSYYVTCVTHNKLRIPIGEFDDNSCSVDLSASITLDVAGVQVGGKEDWSGSMSVDWSETFTFKGNSSGGIDIVSTNGRVHPKFPGPRFSGEPGKVILAKILARLKDVAVNIDLGNLTGDLQKIFNGCWAGSDDHVVKRIVFNHHGDLVLELERREPVLRGKTLWKNDMAHSNGFLHSKVDETVTVSITGNGRTSNPLRPYQFR